jgi:hypothetical protein
VNKVISFLKNLAENDDLRKRDDLRGFYGTKKGKSPGAESGSAF